jgi:hypothetical protein
MKRTRLVALCAAVLTIFMAPARAQPAEAAQKKKPARRVLRLEEMKVEGRVQKPQALFLMPRANVNSGAPDRSEPFLPKVKAAVEKDPF